MSMTLPPAAIQALQQGRKIAAIKIVRTEHHLGLKQAKEHVEQYVQQHPELLRQSRLIQPQQNTSTQWVLWILGLLFLIGLLIWQSGG